MNKDLKISVLNLVYVREGYDSKDAFTRMRLLAEELDHTTYERYCVSEHHNMKSIASSATRLLIQYTLQHTNRIRVGSGGVMLPNHTPYIVAEEFGTMYELFGDRLDIGLGRAPGTDQVTANAIRRGNHQGMFNFEDEIRELQFFLSDKEAHVIANPGLNTNVPLYVLGSSTDSAHIAAKLGLPYAFAAHFAPAMMKEAFEIYERNFQPSEQLKEPYKMACLNVCVQDTQEEAEYVVTSHYQNVFGMITNHRGPMKRPVTNMDDIWSMQHKEIIQTRFPVQILGDKEKALRDLEAFQEEYNADEIIAATAIYDTDAFIKSYKLFEDVVKEYNKKQ